MEHHFFKLSVNIEGDNVR